MYANVNQKACIQCGLCPSICPEVFSLDDGAPAHAITDAVPEDCRLTAQEAADSCPTVKKTCQWHVFSPDLGGYAAVADSPLYTRGPYFLPQKSPHLPQNNALQV